MVKSREETNLTATGQETRIVITGGGIVGSALAYFLSYREDAPYIVLLDESLPEPQGSTAFAPGLVGQLNEISHLTVLAKESVAEYSKIQGAFQPVGCLEIARTQEGILQLNHRLNLALAAGLQAEILETVEVAKLAPDFHAEDVESKALFFPSDGTVNAPQVARYYQAVAQSRGVSIIQAKAFSLSVETSSSSPHVYHIATSKGTISTNTLVVAAGIWTPQLLAGLGIRIPFIPVLHHYAHGPSRPIRNIQQPFIRWPERQIYARDHGDHDGFGTYDHRPTAYFPVESALKEISDGNAVISSALSIFPDPVQRNSKTPYNVCNAMFALTPDGRPLAGKVPNMPGLFVAAAIWITHAAGTARLVADLVAEQAMKEADIEILDAFKPLRFEGQDPNLLKTKALATYNDIYNESHVSS